jgi:hypothetical protein
MNEEVKKALELLKEKANIYDNSARDTVLVTNQLTQTAAALAVLEKALDKTLEIVKKHRLELEPHRHVSVCAPFCLRELDEIIAESEGKQ